MAEDTNGADASPGLATREALLDASIAMFSRFGFESTALAALADSVGVTTGAVYSSFESKQELFVATVLHVREAVEAAVMRGQAIRATPQERAAAYLRSIAGLAVERPDMMAFRIIVPLELARNEGLHAALPDELRARTDLCERVMARDVEGAVVEVTDEIRDRASIILTIGEGITALLQADPGVKVMDPDTAASFFVDLLSQDLLTT